MFWNCKLRLENTHDAGMGGKVGGGGNAVIIVTYVSWYLAVYPEKKCRCNKYLGYLKKILSSR